MRYSKTFMVEAKCPRCERHYTKYLDVEWTGRGTPRIRCPKCVRTMDSCHEPDYEDELDDTTEWEQSQLYEPTTEIAEEMSPD